MWSNYDFQLRAYDSVRDKYRNYKESDFNLVPDYLQVYFSIERKRLDMLDKFYYAVMDYVELGILPCDYIQSNKDWQKIKPFLDQERELSNG